jgi:hypothetical protein
MKSFGLRRYALSGGVAFALLAGCGGSQPPIGAPGARPQTPNALNSFKGGNDGAGSLQAAQSCSGYTECITLAYGLPFKQEWCVVPGTGFPSLGFTKAKCKKVKSGTFGWGAKAYKVSPHRRVREIEASFAPYSGNPTELAIAETQKLRSSGGTVTYYVSLHACQHFSGGWYCSGPYSIGIATKS